MRTKTTLSYIPSCFGKEVKVLNRESFLRLIKSEEVKRVMQLIDQASSEEEKNRLKTQLPAALYACQMTEDGQRPTLQTAVASGLCMHDWDDMKVDPGTFYQSQICGHELEEGIVLAHVTPRGKGLRLVTTLLRGESIVECQERFAKKYGMEACVDKCVKDITRISFLPSADRFLYIDEMGLFGAKYVEDVSSDPPTREAESATDSASENTATKASASKKAVAEAPTMEKTVAETPAVEKTAAETFDYEGIKYSLIIDELLQRLATDGTLIKGERNNVLYSLVRELRHICNYEFQKVYMLVAPYFTDLNDGEVRRTISSAIGSNGRTITPTMKGVLSELKERMQQETPETEHRELTKAPLLPPVMEMICSKYPARVRNHVVVSMLPILGTYGTHIRFRYLDNKVNSLTFMTAVVAPSQSCKSFAANLFGKMTKRLESLDNEERAKYEEYREACESAGEKGKKPKDPRPKVRLYSDDITTNMLLEYQDNHRGEHGLQFTEEVTRLKKSRRSSYGDNDDLYCKAFDNAVAGKESKSKLTRNVRTPMFLNTLFLGTPAHMHEFYNDPEGGLNNRVIFITLPKESRQGIPFYADFTAEEEKQFDETCNMLWEAGTKEGEEEYKFPILDQLMRKYEKQCIKEDDENPNEVWFDTRKRAMVIGYRAGVAAWFLWGCPSEDDKATWARIKKFVLWVIETVRIGNYNFNGQEYERINEENHKTEARKAPKSHKLYSILPDKFTTQQVQALRQQNGESTRVDMILKQWTDSGMIQRTSHGCYTKLKNTAA